MPPERIIFNQEIAIDFLWLENRLVLHVMYTHTYVSKATWVGFRSAHSIWLAFLEFCTTVICGLSQQDQ